MVPIAVANLDTSHSQASEQCSLWIREYERLSPLRCAVLGENLEIFSRPTSRHIGSMIEYGGIFSARLAGGEPDLFLLW